MSNTKTRLTFADYLETSDDERYELLNGELILSPSPKEIHQYISSRLHLKIGTHARNYNLGKVYFSPFDVVLSEWDVVQPDLLFVSNERISIINADNVHGAPDLVVEILSSATAVRDRSLKLDLYAKHGVKEYWIVDPDAKRINVLLRGESGLDLVSVYREEQTLRSPTLGEVNMALKEVF